MTQRSATRNTRYTHTDAGNENYLKYPVTNDLLNVIIVISLITLLCVFINVFNASADPPFKIEIETNSSSETPMNQTALNRQFNKIYEYLTSARSEAVSGPSFRMDVKSGKTNTGITIAIFFSVFVTLFICWLGMYGIDKEEPKLLIPFHCLIDGAATMFAVLSVAFIISAFKKEIDFGTFGVKSEDDKSTHSHPDCELGWASLLFCILGIGIIPFCVMENALWHEFKKMETTNMGNTPRPSAPDLAISNV